VAYSPFEVSLVQVFMAAGWDRSYSRPRAVVPRRGRFVRALSTGWAAVVEIDLEPSGTRQPGVTVLGLGRRVGVAGGLTLPEAERLAAVLGYPRPDDVRLTMPDLPTAEGGLETQEQIGDSEDEQLTIAQVLRFAEDVVLPWAEGLASADGWLEAQSRIREEDPVTFHGEYAPIVLIASGRQKDALEHLATAERRPEFGDDEWSATFAKKVRSFVGRGDSVPTPADGLFDPDLAPDFDVAVRHDARHAEFMSSMKREVDAGSARVKWRYAGGSGLKALQGVGRFRNSARGPHALEERWRSVPYDPASEPVLERVFERAGARVAWEIMVDVEVRPLKSGVADVLVDDSVVGRLSADALPEDVNAWPKGPAAARLSRKPREPKYLLELRLLVDIGP
jgi:hypothetical protein